MENMITEDYVSFETAELLKEKGFDGEDAEGCFAFYKENGEIGFLQTFGDVADYYNLENPVIAPTLQMAMKWLREMHGIHIDICLDTLDGITPIYQSCYSVITNISTNNFIDFANTYEEACEIGIKYCLESLI